MTIVLGNEYAKCIHRTSDICDCGSLASNNCVHAMDVPYIYIYMEELRVLKSLFGWWHGKLPWARPHYVHFRAPKIDPCDSYLCQATFNFLTPIIDV